jgi:hypothetical protein
MIISASRRTDIPAFYARWFINRIRSGYCTVPNPFNARQISRISLGTSDVDVVVFWTRNPRPLFPYLKELDSRGYRYYFQYTLLGNPRLIDPHAPPLEIRLRTFYELVEQVGPRRVIWRYDPIVFTEITPADFHHRMYEKIAVALNGYTTRSVISLMDVYAKAKKRLAEMGAQGAPLLEYDADETWYGELMRHMLAAATANGMQIFSCAQERNLQPYGILPGKCVDDDYILDVFGLDVSHTKDPSQRKTCGCVVSKDIGMYNSCLYGCQYCYATSNFKKAHEHFKAHAPSSPSLLGWYEVEEKAAQADSNNQPALF